MKAGAGVVLRIGFVLALTGAAAPAFASAREERADAARPSSFSVGFGVCAITQAEIPSKTISIGNDSLKRISDHSRNIFNIVTRTVNLKSEI